MCWGFFDKYPVVELLGHMSSIFNFLRNLYTGFHSAVPFAIPPTVYKGSLFSTSLPTLVCWFTGHSVLTDVRGHLIVVLICISLITSDVEHPFIYYGPCVCLPWRSLFRSFAHFLIGLFVLLALSYKSSLYILKIKPVSKVLLWANMFPHMVGSLFTLMLFSLAV